MLLEKSTPLDDVVCPYSNGQRRESPALTWGNDNSSPNPTTETQERGQFMGRSNLLEEVRVKSIFHPSDFSEASEVAFAHALKIALVAGATLTMLHVEASHSTEWQDFPAYATHSSDGSYPNG